MYSALMRLFFERAPWGGREGREENGGIGAASAMRCVQGIWPLSGQLGIDGLGAGLTIRHEISK
jgi:hypothetical protein